MSVAVEYLRKQLLKPDRYKMLEFENVDFVDKICILVFVIGNELQMLFLLFP